MAGLNVLTYCLSSVSGGAVAYLQNLASLLAELFARGGEGHNLNFLAHEEQAPLLKGVDDSQVCWVRGVRPEGYHRVVWERRNLTRILREHGANVLFTPYQIGPSVRGTKNVLMLRNMEPFLCGGHGYRYCLRSRLRNELLRQASLRSLRRADRVIAVSDFTQDRLTNRIGVENKRVRTIYHGRNEDFASHGDVEKDHDVLDRCGVRNHYILTCGSLLPYRRCEDVIAAFNRCANHLPVRVQLVIAGAEIDSRYARVVHGAIASSPLREQIRYVGHVPWDTMAALYRQCLAFVMASEIEACPNIAIEAMTAGSAIVSSDRAPLPEMFRGCSLEYRARDVAHLVRQMRLTVEDASLRRELKVRAKQRAEAFSWERCARETYAALTEWPDGED
jgi:glycosyltransferase involved in cell wall biosynthesis